MTLCVLSLSIHLLLMKHFHLLGRREKKSICILFVCVLVLPFFLFSFLQFNAQFTMRYSLLPLLLLIIICSNIYHMQEQKKATENGKYLPFLMYAVFSTGGRKALSLYLFRRLVSQTERWTCAGK